MCHWEGYDTDWDTYEPLANIPHGARELIAEFKRGLKAPASTQKRKRKSSN